MIISENLKNAVLDNDLTAIRSSFYTILLSDPGFETDRFDEALEYVKSHNVKDLIDEHDGEELLEKEYWNEEYFDLLASKLQDNFSKERIKQLKTVAKEVYSCDSDDEVKKDEYTSNVSTNKAKTIISDICFDDKYAWVRKLGIFIVVVWFIRYIFKGDEWYGIKQDDGRCC